MIRPVEEKDLMECLAVIKDSSMTVADEFGLTTDNCPTNGAFMPYERLENDYKKGNKMFAICEGDKIAGFAQLEAKDNGSYELAKLTVLPAYRHKGYGKQLVEFCYDVVKTLKGNKIVIGIIEENTRLKNWYIQNGFVHTGTKLFPHLPFTVGFMEIAVAQEEFDSEYCNVKYIPEDHVVLLRWKKYCHLEDYRRPTMFAASLLAKYEGSNFIVDARNGFVDDKEDAEWGASYLLPEIAKTPCRFVSFIMNDIAETGDGMDEEMDMWTVSFGKYFAVTKAENYGAALLSIRKYVLVNARYTIQAGKREEFYRKLQEEEIATASRQEPGNIKYDFYYPLDSSDDICLMEMWTNQHELKRHAATAHYDALSRLKEIYVKKIKISKYGIKEYV